MRPSSTNMDLESLLEQGLVLFGENRTDEAVALWTRVLVMQPAEPRAIDYIESAGVNPYSLSFTEALAEATERAEQAGQLPAYDDMLVREQEDARTRRSWVARAAVGAAFLGLAVAAGVVAYGSMQKGAAAPRPVAASLAAPTPHAATKPEPTKEQASAAAPASRPEQTATQQEVARMRKRALRHILGNEYDAAAKLLTRALTMSEDSGDLIDMLALVKDLQSRPTTGRPAARTVHARRGPARTRRPAARSSRRAASAARAGKAASSLGGVALAPIDIAAVDAPGRRRQRRVSMSEPISDDDSRLCVRSPTPGHTVAINGVEYGTAPVDVDLPPGEVHIELRSKDGVVERRTVKTKKGKIKRVSFE